MNWNDPAERAALIERVGIEEYNRQFEEHRKASIVDTVAGHEIRPAHSFRFGPLFLIGETGVAYAQLEDARTYAKGHPLCTG